MKNLFITLLNLIGLTVYGQSLSGKFDIHTWTPPYTLPIPTGWTTERFLIPIDFAPQIPYKGIEELRFTPGWGKPNSPDYWSYAYLWWLEGNPQINAGSLQKHLTDYYNGLVNRNIADRHILTRKTTSTTVDIKKKSKNTDGEEYYSGTIAMFDYMAQANIILNCVIHVTNCTKQNRTAVLFELSPKPAEHTVWQKLHSLQTSFTYNK
ncbi:hypothetical protein GCM10028807_61680 [Spirosoma daeguense]